MTTRQEFFDTTVQLLLKQGRPALNSANCAYRGDGGTKCAIGHWIPDEEYKKEPAEQVSLRSALEQAYWPTINQLAETVPETLMSAMQSAHDGIGLIYDEAGNAQDFGDYDQPAKDVYDEIWVEQFKARAKLVAEIWKLDTKVLS